MHEAKTSLSKLIALVEAGETVQIARNGEPIVDLSLSEKRTRPLFGEFEPFDFDIPADFDSPTLEELEAWDLMETKFENLLDVQEIREKRPA